MTAFDASLNLKFLKNCRFFRWKASAAGQNATHRLQTGRKPVRFARIKPDGARSVPGSLGEWLLNRANISAPEHEALGWSFHPTQFHSRGWTDIFRDAGARYVNPDRQALRRLHDEPFPGYPASVSTGRRITTGTRCGIWETRYVRHSSATVCTTPRTWTATIATPWISPLNPTSGKTEDLYSASDGTGERLGSAGRVVVRYRDWRQDADRTAQSRRGPVPAAGADITRIVGDTLTLKIDDDHKNGKHTNSLSRERTETGKPVLIHSLDLVSAYTTLLYASVNPQGKLLRVPARALTQLAKTALRESVTDDITPASSHTRYPHRRRSQTCGSRARRALCRSGPSRGRHSSISRLWPWENGNDRS